MATVERREAPEAKATAPARGRRPNDAANAPETAVDPLSRGRATWRAWLMGDTPTRPDRAGWARWFARGVIGDDLPRSEARMLVHEMEGCAPSTAHRRRRHDRLRETADEVCERLFLARRLSRDASSVLAAMGRHPAVRDRGQRPGGPTAAVRRAVETWAAQTLDEPTDAVLDQLAVNLALTLPPACGGQPERVRATLAVLDAAVARHASGRGVHALTDVLDAVEAAAESGAVWVTVATAATSVGVRDGDLARWVAAMIACARPEGPWSRRWRESLADAPEGGLDAERRAAVVDAVRATLGDGDAAQVETAAALVFDGPGRVTAWQDRVRAHQAALLQLGRELGLAAAGHDAADRAQRQVRAIVGHVAAVMATATTAADAATWAAERVGTRGDLSPDDAVVQQWTHVARVLEPVLAEVVDANRRAWLPLVMEAVAGVVASARRLLRRDDVDAGPSDGSMGTFSRRLVRHVEATGGLWAVPQDEVVRAATLLGAVELRAVDVPVARATLEAATLDVPADTALGRLSRVAAPAITGLDALVLLRSHGALAESVTGTMFGDRTDLAVRYLEADLAPWTSTLSIVLRLVARAAALGHQDPTATARAMVGSAALDAGAAAHEPLIRALCDRTRPVLVTGIGAISPLTRRATDVLEAALGRVVERRADVDPYAVFPPLRYASQVGTPGDDPSWTPVADAVNQALRAAVDGDGDVAMAAVGDAVRLLASAGPRPADPIAAHLVVMGIVETLRHVEPEAATAAFGTLRARLARALALPAYVHAHELVGTVERAYGVALAGRWLRRVRGSEALGRALFTVPPEVAAWLAVRAAMTARLRGPLTGLRWSVPTLDDAPALARPVLDRLARRVTHGVAALDDLSTLATRLKATGETLFRPDVAQEAAWRELVATLAELAALDAVHDTDLSVVRGLLVSRCAVFDGVGPDHWKRQAATLRTWLASSLPPRTLAAVAAELGAVAALLERRQAVGTDRSALARVVRDEGGTTARAAWTRARCLLERVDRTAATGERMRALAACLGVASLDSVAVGDEVVQVVEGLPATFDAAVAVRGVRRLWTGASDRVGLPDEACAAARAGLWHLLAVATGSGRLDAPDAVDALHAAGRQADIPSDTWALVLAGLGQQLAARVDPMHPAWPLVRVLTATAA
ncbi:MAG: hypothetical protein H6733_15560 [Alphaproteobacteria bacterium]|nr:hypothetical protein [Alphaproteobacteria bacterium]